MDLLLRVYTQNIDGLEAIAGVKHIIEAHGSLQRAVCLKCQKTMFSVESENSMDGEQTKFGTIYQYIQSSLQRSIVPSCPRSVPSRKKGLADRKRIKLTNAEEEDVPIVVESQRICGGVLKPGITFFGEKLDSRIGTTLEKDKDDVDLLLVIGTSLSVYVALLLCIDSLHNLTQHRRPFSFL